MLKAALRKWSDRLDAKFKERVPILSESLDDYLSRVKLLSPQCSNEDLAYCYYLSKQKPQDLPRRFLELGVMTHKPVKLAL